MKAVRLDLDPSKITGPWALFALVALVVEGLLFFWLSRADDGIERGFAGVIMALTLLALLYAAVSIRRTETATGSESAVSPPVNEASAQDVTQPPAETLVGPDRSYLIDRPPAGWRVSELSLADWVGVQLGITDPATRDSLLGDADASREILVIERERKTSVIPVPGKTKIDGRRLPTALETEIPNRLAIIPLDRAQPPLYVERTLEHNFLQVVSVLIRSGVLTARQSESGVISNTHRHFLSVDLQQRIEDAIVDGREDQNVVNTMVVMGIQGDLRDYVLLINYALLESEELKDDNKTVQQIVNSFRPVKAVDPEARRAELAAEADESFQNMLATSGEEIFFNEFGLLSLRLRGLDLDEPDDRLRAIKLLRPFEPFAREVGLVDEDLDALFEAMHRAERGDATEFKTSLTALLEAAEEELDSEEEEVG